MPPVRLSAVATVLRASRAAATTSAAETRHASKSTASSSTTSARSALRDAEVKPKSSRALTK